MTIATKRPEALVTACLGLALATSVFTAHAQDRSYEELIEEGLLEFRLEHWREARKLFEEAHAQRPSARTLRGIAVTSYELREYADATRAGLQALTSTVDPLTEAQKQEMQQLLGRAARFVGRYYITLSPSTATLKVDERPTQLDAAGSVLLNIGPHTVRADAPGYRPVVSQFETRGGERSSLRLELPVDSAVQATAPIAPIAPSAPPVAPAAPVTAPAASPPASGASPPPAAPPPTTASDAGSSPAASAEPPARDGGPSRAGPIVLMSLGGAALIGSAVTGLLALGHQSELEDNCDRGTPCSDSFQSDQEAAETLAVVTDVLWIGGGVLAAAGLTWLLLTPSSEAETRPSAALQALPQLAPDRAGLTLRGRF